MSISEFGHRLIQSVFGLRDSLGNIIDPATSDNQPVAAFGEALTAQLSPIFQGSFEYTVDNTEITTNTVSNGGTVSQSNAMAVALRLVKDATLGGSPSYSDINTSDSIVELDTAGTTVSSGRELMSVELAGKNDRVFQDVESFKLLLGPQETLTLAVSSANSATFNGSVLWRELF